MADLPAELLITIFRLLDCHERIVSLVCRSWRYASKLLGPRNRSFGYLVCEDRMLAGSESLLRWAHTELKFPLARAQPYFQRCAVNQGRLDVLRYLKAHGHAINPCVCQEACGEHGSLELLKKLRAMGCPWDETAVAHALHWNQVEILKWLKANRAPHGYWTRCNYTYLSRNKNDAARWMENHWPEAICELF